MARVVFWILQWALPNQRLPLVRYSSFVVKGSPLRQRVVGSNLSKVLQHNNKALA